MYPGRRAYTCVWRLLSDHEEASEALDDCIGHHFLVVGVLNLRVCALVRQRHDGQVTVVWQIHLVARHSKQTSQGDGA